MTMHEDNAVRARLIGAAKAEFLRCGYAKASLRTIAREAGVSTGSVYFFFGSKEALFHAVVDGTAEALPSGKTVTQLRFTPIPAVVTAGTNLTDDPLGEQAAIGYVRAGVTVQWLATMGDWAYVESTDGSLLRGFVPLARIAADGEWEK